ncbi:MAG: nitroreductase family deazaflavin-dependent oxidoreductase [Chloroflexi bacterium]|nr:nitroreductase family deazaflavin-dependent oxidoreductase [Chloroflexota bacterium]MDL1885060.1 nitroreductase family deazaflavin-dependent oxidoreductase [Anaerolineae bacterium CFX8]
MLPVESSAGPPAMPYPAGALKALLRAPLLLYRLGLGDLLNAIHIMVLVTRGRKSGQPRYTPIEYRRHGSKIYLVSGWGARPQWYKNLLDDPLAAVQMGSRLRSVRAQIVTDPAEALRALYLFRRTAPSRYDAVLSFVIESSVNARTLPNLSGQFTIVRLDLTPDEPPLPGISGSLAWLGPLLLVGGVGLAALVIASGRRKSEG